MGVPAFFRWLSRKYPKIITPVIEESVGVEEFGGPTYNDPNPNGEIDNLYLDMNGIVHPCTHPDHKPAPETEDEMLLDVFQYTDRVLMMARPRKVLMMAVDGVAPRAKMNQQRARRFRAAQDAKLEAENREKELKERELRGEMIEQAVKGKKSWDTNAITPGTPFMDKLGEALKYWVAYKLSNDPGWKDLQVIISDSSVPGEGEHKLMNFIRSQRTDPQYDPNTKHCIYGLDADLIFLGLATHEPHFRVLREDVFANQSRKLGHAEKLNMSEEDKELLKEQDAKKPFLWLHINVLREYLAVELYNPKLSFGFDLERAIDDWIFMCFFVGNDFLPHIASLDVRDNGIELLVGCWKKVLTRLPGYITCDGNLNLKSVIKLMNELGSQEDGIFKKRYENEKRREENQKRRKVWEEEENRLRNQFLPTLTKGKDKAPIVPDTNMPLMNTSGEVVEGYAKLTNSDLVNNMSTINQANLANADAAERLKKLIASKNNPSAVEAVKAMENPTKKRKLESEESQDEPVVINKPSESETERDTTDKSDIEDQKNQDNVRIWEDGYNTRYYQTKFHLTTDEEVQEQRKKLVYHYLEGISWVLLYYYQGCPSWQWYFPYHYAPFAQDFEFIDEAVIEKGITFTKDKPFKPFEQLMSVMPAASCHTLPDGFEPLMKDEDSPIIDFYPEEFEIDMNGAKMAWQGIPLLPFIDENRLLKAVEKVYATLTPEEINRNTLKDDVLFISCQNKHFQNFKRLYEDNHDGKVEKIEFKHQLTKLSGKVKPYPGFEINEIFKFPLKEGELPNLNNNEYLQLQYFMPPRPFIGKSMLLNGYIPHLAALQQSDIDGILYGNQRNRFRSPNDNRDYINHGPQGKKLFMMYGSRKGGYRALLVNKKSQQEQQQQYQQQQKAMQQMNYQMQMQQTQQMNYNGYQNQYQNNHYQNNQYQNNNQYNNSQYQNNQYNNQYQNNQYQTQYNQGYNRGYNQGQYNQNYRNGYQGNGQSGHNGYGNGNFQGNNGYR